MNEKHSCSWYSDLYTLLEMRTYVAEIDNGVAVVKNTVGDGNQVIIK